MCCPEHEPICREHPMPRILLKELNKFKERIENMISQTDIQVK